MASNFTGQLFGSIPLTFGTKTDLGWLEVWKVENDLNFSSFTTVAYYIDFGGHTPGEYWAWHWLTPIPNLGLPMHTVHSSLAGLLSLLKTTCEKTQLFAPCFEAHSFTLRSPMNLVFYLQESTFNKLSIDTKISRKIEFLKGLNWRRKSWNLGKNVAPLKLEINHSKIQLL